MDQNNLEKFVENMASDMGEMQNDMADISMDLDEVCNDIKNLLKEIQSMDKTTKNEDEPAPEPMTVYDLRDNLHNLIALRGVGSDLVTIDHKPIYPDAVDLDVLKDQVNIDTGKCGKAEADKK